MLKFIISEDLQWLILQDYTEEVDRKQLELSLTRKIHNHFFHPLVKKKLWSGEICFVDKKGPLWRIPVGLWSEVFDICEKYKIEVEIIGLDNIIDSTLTLEDFTIWANDFFKDKELKPRDYQIEAAWKIVRFRFSGLEIATSSGKTLIAFIVLAYLKNVRGINKFLMIVPNTTLIIQGAEDFEGYGLKELDNCDIQLIHGGNKNKLSGGLMIGTYQSLVKQEDTFFDGVEAVFVDECLDPNTDILMGDGSYKKISNVNVGDTVVTINDKTGEKENSDVDFVYKNLSKSDIIYEIETLSGKTIRITGNHKVKLINGCWKKVEDLSESDELYDI
jgi:hypothetical protein